MIRKFEIYNFDHGYTHSAVVNIKPFKIYINEEHCENLNSLERREGKTFTINDTEGSLDRVVLDKPRVKGSTCVTAIIEIEELKIIPSKIYMDEEYNSVDDFVLFLSFITGRTAYLEHQLDDRSSVFYLEPVVNHNFFNIPIVDLIGGFERIEEQKLSAQFYNLVYANVLNDLPGLCFYANSTVNAVYERWCKQNGHTKYPQPKPIIEGLKKKLRTHLENSLNTKFKTWLYETLNSEGVSEEVSQDVLARLKISNEPSAIYKFKKFLIGLNLYPKVETKECEDRIKWINRVRNNMVHNGDIPSDKALSFEKRAEISTSITFILFGIAEYYFAKHIFHIDNYLVDEREKHIRTFFETGEYHGKGVFDESFVEYIKRQEKEWISNGNFV